MMRFYIIRRITLMCLGIALTANQLRAQDKPMIDTAAINNWPKVIAGSISSDGKYAGYRLMTNSMDEGQLVVTAVNRKWKYSRQRNESYYFTENGFLVSLNSDKVLSIVRLGESAETQISNVLRYSCFESGNTSWLLIYKPDNSITLSKVGTTIAKTYSQISGVSQDAEKRQLILKSGNENAIRLTAVDLRNLKERYLGEFANLSDITFSENGKEFGFIATDLSRQSKVPYLYKEGKNLPVAIFDKQDSEDQDKGILDGIDRISNDGRFVFLRYTKVLAPNIKQPGVHVKVWSTGDEKLLSEKKSTVPQIQACFDLQTHKLKVISEGINERCYSFQTREDIVVIEENTGSTTTPNRNERRKYFLYDVNSGSRRPLNFLPNVFNASPDGHYLIGTSFVQNSIVCYNIDKDRLSTIREIPGNNELASTDQGGFLFAAWSDDHTVYYYDQNDIYQADVAEASVSKCITNGFGRKNNITFRFALHNLLSATTPKGVLELLTAFDNQNKKNGYYRLVSGKDPQYLHMGNHFTYMSDYVLGGMQPEKARKSSAWLVSFETSDSSSNLYVTNDFLSYEQVSHNYPERSYNWMHTELLNFTAIDGSQGQAIVYKPDNFDSSKKYPVIMHYYEEKTSNLNRFLLPEKMIGHLNIPWFVSRGYIVCTPDIRYKKSQTGASVYNHVYGAAKALSACSYVDSTAVGLFGHSFGGYETCELVTRTGFFKAAVASAGFTDLVSLVGTIYPSGETTGLEFTEHGQNRIDHSIWERPDLYLDNSPLFKADRVKTPLLMINNEKDGIVPVTQGLEFFIALRRLKKTAWLLQYADEDHTLGNEDNMIDFTNKVEGFFGYWLLKKEKPKWMINK